MQPPVCHRGRENVKGPQKICMWQMSLREFGNEQPPPPPSSAASLMNICSAGGRRIKDKGINGGCERPKGAKEGSQKWGEHPLPHPTMSKQQQLPGIGDSCLLGKILQVCASDKVGLRFQGVSKRRGVPRKKRKKRKDKRGNCSQPVQQSFAPFGKHKHFRRASHTQENSAAANRIKKQSKKEGPKTFSPWT